MRFSVSGSSNRPGATATATAPYGEFCYVPEGEIVASFGAVCCNAGGCGCDRSISGTTTYRATTTAKVVEREVSWDDLFQLAAKAGKETGWGGPIVWNAIQSTVEAVEELDVGTVVEPRYDDINERWKYVEVSPEQMAPTDV